MANPQNFKNILFDLGGVILDINVQATLKQFYELGFPAELMQFPHSMTTDLYFKYETGKLDSVAFRNEIRKKSGVEMSDQRFDEAWNAMLVRIPKERTDLLKLLSNRYDLYMLSNTSELHVKVFEKMYFDAAGVSMHEVFKKIYYSHEIGWLKPDHEAWEYVISDAGIKPEETLFLDDNIHNIKASQELGFHAIHIHERTHLMNLGFDL
ncbi:MAG: HAD family phosphatase [Bacteroidia bacterium]|nr:MAG: HAD family phosphatase [Bacteroidia bacterium]